MARGAFRVYFHIGPIGIKLPRYCRTNGNPWLVFICGCMMNFLERKRYKYYVKGKAYKQWGTKWRFKKTTPLILNPTYFSCGLFSIVRHCPTPIDKNWFYSVYDERMGGEAKSHLYKQTAHLCIMDDKPESFMINKEGKMVCVDYGEFTLSYSCRTGIQHIDYK
jgi:hypothetical protein